MSFDRSRLPDPISYFEGQGMRFRERKGKWRTTSCFNCTSSDGMRVNTDSGAFVCMTACGARGGDVVAYVQAALGLSFVEAARALGAWIEDGREVTRTKPTSIPVRDALAVLSIEAYLVAIAAGNVAHGVNLTEADRLRVLQAAGRIAYIREAVMA